MDARERRHIGRLIGARRRRPPWDVRGTVVRGVQVAAVFCTVGFATLAALAAAAGDPWSVAAAAAAGVSWLVWKVAG